MIEPRRWVLTPERAARQITRTPKGQFALYDEKKGEIVKSDRWIPPDFRSLIKIAQTEQGRSEVSCVFEKRQNTMMAKPLIFSEETGPTHFTFANLEALGAVVGFVLQSISMGFVAMLVMDSQMSAMNQEK